MTQHAASARSLTAMLRAHGIAILIVCMYTAYAFRVSTQLPRALRYHWQDFPRILMMLKMRDNPKLYEHDYLMAYTDRMGWYFPAYLSLIRTLGSAEHDYEDGFDALIPIVYVLFFSGCYLFFVGNGMSPVTSSLLSIAAGLEYHSTQYETWGLTSTTSPLSRSCFLCFFPWLMLLHSRTLRTHWEPIAFFLVGIAGNLHPLSGYAVSALMLVCSAVVGGGPSGRRFSIGQLCRMSVCGLCAIAGILPSVIDFTRQAAPSYAFPGSAAFRTFRSSLAGVSPPGTIFLTQWLAPSIPVIALALLAWILLHRSKSLKQLDIAYAGFGIATIPLFIMLPQFLQSHAPRLDPMLVGELSRGFKFVMWPLFYFAGRLLDCSARILISQATATLVQAHLGLGILFVFYMASLSGIPPTYSCDEPERRRIEDLRGVCRWIRRHTSPSDSFLCDDDAFRAWSERSTGYSYGDLLLVGNEQAFRAWAGRTEQIRRIGMTPENYELREMKNLAKAESLARRWGCSYLVLRQSSSDSTPSTDHVEYRMGSVYVLKVSG